MKQLTPAQLQATKERKEKRAAMVKAIAAMSDEQRAALASKILAVNTEGHTYSAKNQILIAFQRANCTVLTGFHQWKKAGRSVKKGEHGLSIWIPCNAPKKDSDEPEGEIYFSMGTVFDISQTEAINA